MKGLKEYFGVLEGEQLEELAQQGLDSLLETSFDINPSTLVMTAEFDETNAELITALMKSPMARKLRWLGMKWNPKTRVLRISGKRLKMVSQLRSSDGPFMNVTVGGVPLGELEP